MRHDPVELLQTLIRFNTTNPPGAESECIAWAKELCDDAGLETRVLAKADDRPNLIARLPGRGAARPLMLQGHVDVVTTEGQTWAHDPFGGELIDGYVWGRGALDMKGGVAMLLGAILALAEQDEPPPGDVLLCLVADEEALGSYGARFLVEEHPEVFENVKHCLGEFGGFRNEIAGLATFPIQVAEKQVCWMRVTVRGPAGHGSMPLHGGAMARLGRLLTRLDENRLPTHITPVPQAMIEKLAAAFPQGGDELAAALLDPARTDATLDTLGPAGAIFDPVLHNTVNATIVSGGDKFNVVPGEVHLDLDGRLLPGQSPDDVIAELRALADDDTLEFEVVEYQPGPAYSDLSLFDLLAGVLTDAEPGAIPLPLLLPGVTDGRFFSKLGIQTYGFLPMRLPPEMSFTQLIHAADERVPAEEIRWGCDRIVEAANRYDVA